MGDERRSISISKARYPLKDPECGLLVPFLLHLLLLLPRVLAKHVLTRDSLQRK